MVAEALSIAPGLFRPLKRAEYDRLIELGAFVDERIELIRGVLVKMSPQKGPRAGTVEKLSELLIAQVHRRFRVRSQLPIALSDDTEPEPDAAVIDLGSSYFEHPHTARLIIEVADSSLKDIVNLGARTVEVYTAPHGARYDELRTLRSGDILRPTNVPDVEIAVSEILPPA